MQNTFSLNTAVFNIFHIFGFGATANKKFVKLQICFFLQKRKIYDLHVFTDRKVNISLECN